MKIREKLEAFSKIAMHSATDTNAAMQIQLDADFANACEQAKQEAQQAAKTLLDEERQAAEQEKTKAVLEASSEARKTLIAKRAELTARLFARVEQDIDAYTETETYVESMVVEISKLAEAYPAGIVVQLCPRDMRFAEKITLPNVVIVQGADAMRGGYIAQVNNSAIRFDCSYAQKLADARVAFNGFKITE